MILPPNQTRGQIFKMGNEQPLMEQPQTWSRFEARSELARVLVSADEFDAFCLDKCGQAYRQFTRGMNRIEKENILLELFSPDFIIAALRTYKQRPAVHIEPVKPVRFIGPESAKDIEETAIENAEQNQLNEQLTDLEEQRDRLDDQDLDTTYVIQEIRSIRKKLKQRPALEKNNIFAKKYRLIEMIGRGGYSIVWSARDLHVKRRVAIKFLHPQYTNEASIVKRFNRGAKRMEQLAEKARLTRAARDQDFCLVRTIEQPRQERGYIYFVMDYLEGGDLHAAIIENKINQEKAIDSVLQVGDLLQFAHQCGITHRDIKPDNILLTSDGRSCLTDFDAVWALNTTSSIHGNQHVGTVSYMPPEVLEQWDQAIKDEESELDELDSSRSLHAANVLRDIYSLGLTLTFVYYGKNLPPIMSHPDFQERFLAQLQCPPAIKTAIARAIACDPKKRTQTIRDFCADVRAGLHLHNRLGAEPVLRVAEPREASSLAESLASTQLFIKVKNIPLNKDALREMDALREFEKTRPSIDTGWLDMAAALDTSVALPTASLSNIANPIDPSVRRRRSRVWIALGVCSLLVLGLAAVFWASGVASPDGTPSGATNAVVAGAPTEKPVKPNRPKTPPPPNSVGPSAGSTGQANSSSRSVGPEKAPPHSPPPETQEEPPPTVERLTPQAAHHLAVQIIEDYRNQGNPFDRQCRNLGAHGIYIFDIALDTEAHVSEVNIVGQISEPIKQCLITSIKSIAFPIKLAQQRVQNLDIVIDPK